ncbi:MAG TPA: hypothetical protein VMH28_33265 [Candidatus Acidoferrales bacterium]|nr:hypothetical protein [Candidatus Acidoferrales bacterium]
MWKLLVVLASAAALSAAALDDNTVTVTATRTLNIQPDQVLLYVNLISQDGGLNDVLTKLHGTGITAANLTSVQPEQTVYDPSEPLNPTSVWNFLVRLSFAQLKSSVAALTQAQAGLKPVGGLQALSYYIAGTQVSADAQAAQPCPLTALVSDARRQADSMAAAAGMRTGAIVAIGDAASAEVTAGFAVPTAVSRVGDFSLLLGVPNQWYSTPVLAASPQLSCSLTVQFKLLP